MGSRACWRSVAFLFVSLVPVSLALGQTAQHGDHEGGHQKHEGAITYTKDGVEHSTMVLGGALGTQSVADVTVGLFVLQAESPERLGEGGSGPTHIFNVTFTDEESQALLNQARGTIVVSGADGSQQSAEFRPFRKHFQARFRLEHPGDYLIKVAFESGERKGTTESYPFTYRRKLDSAESNDGADEHAHH